MIIMSNRQMITKAENLSDEQLMIHTRKRGKCTCMKCFNCICYMTWETRKANRGIKTMI